MLCHVQLPPPFTKMDQDLEKFLTGDFNFLQCFAYGTILGGYVKALAYSVQMIVSRSFSLGTCFFIIAYALPLGIGIKAKETKKLTPGPYNTNPQPLTVDVGKPSGSLYALSIVAQVLDIALYAGSTSWQRTAMKCALSPAVLGVLLCLD